MTLEVRPATVMDAPALVPLIDELGYRSTAAQIGATLARLASSPDDRVLLALDGGTAVGLISCHVLDTLHIPGRLGRITALVVAGTHQRRGLGAQLIRSAEVFFRSAGCTRVEVTSGVRREEAHAFYRAQGFAETSRRFVKSLGGEAAPRT